jgi:hypothetical protein
MLVVSNVHRMLFGNCHCAKDSKCIVASSHQERPYHDDNTASRLLSEVKHRRARLVLRWGTTLESRVLFFCTHHLATSLFAPIDNDARAIAALLVNTFGLACLATASMHALVCSNLLFVRVVWLCKMGCCRQDETVQASSGEVWAMISVSGDSLAS